MVEAIQGLNKLADQMLAHLSGMLSSMDADMQDIGTATEQTVSAISSMNHDLDSYRI